MRMPNLLVWYKYKKYFTEKTKGKDKFCNFAQAQPFRGYNCPL